MKILKTLMALAALIAVCGCNSTEQTTEAEAQKAATQGQTPDPAAADSGSPMGGMKKGGG